MSDHTHSLMLPLTYLDPPWNHDFHVICSCGWAARKVSHDADKRGHAYPNLVARSEQVISLHALEVNLLALLQADHGKYHAGDKATRHHRVTSLRVYQSRPGHFDVTCTDSCGFSATLSNRRYLKGRITLEQLATDLRRQFYFHCYTPSPLLRSADPSFESALEVAMVLPPLSPNPVTSDSTTK